MTIQSTLNSILGLNSIEEDVMSAGEMKKLYQRPPSFINYLGFTNYDPDFGCFMLQDNLSCGIVLEIQPLDAESRSKETLEGFMEVIESALQVIPKRSHNPWIQQTYVQDEPVAALLAEIEDYAKKHGGENNPVRDHYISLMKDHLAQISRDEGLFDEDATGVSWRAKYRRARIVLYRHVSRRNWPDKVGNLPKNEISNLKASLLSSLSEAGLQTRSYNGNDLFMWLYPWFNPQPRGFKSPYDYLSEANISNEDLDWDFDIAGGLIQNMPRTEGGSWYFNNRPHRYMAILGHRGNPAPGAMMLESTNETAKKAAIMDRLPNASIFVTTTIYLAQDVVNTKVEFVHERAKGGTTAQAKRAKLDAKDVQDAMEDHKLYPTSMGVYLTAKDDVEMDDRLNKTFALLQAERLNVISAEYDLVAANAYVSYLPMSYRFEYDSLLQRKNFQWLRDTISLAPFLGQGVGTSNPGFVFYNRAGQPLLIDPINSDDRVRAAHMLLLGPTGAGKSATLNSLLLQAFANHKPHIYVIDVGDSFRLLGDYYEAMGLKVNYINLDSASFGLPPFANSQRVLDRNASVGVDVRDYLGEMEAAAKLMITGGDPIELNEFRRHDRAILQAAVTKAAMTARDNNVEHARIDDFVSALDGFIKGETPPDYDIPISKEGRKRLEEMRDAARIFTKGNRGRLFNGFGQDIGDADVTIIDLGKIGMNKENTDIMNLAVIGLLNNIQSQAEKRRGKGRQSILVIDEAHVTTTNPLVADYLAKGSKMWRKWGLWLWMATQDMQDFPDTSKRILNMAEFWFCLSMPIAEIEEIQRFKRLTDEEKALLESARKEKHKYVEGVILSTKKPLLFRNVPPSLLLSLAGTEDEEVEERREVMAQYGLETDLEGVYKVAELISERRAKK